MNDSIYLLISNAGVAVCWTGCCLLLP